VSSVLGALMSIGPIALLAAVISVPICYLGYRRAPEPKSRLAVVRFVLGTLGAGVVAYLVGVVVGVAVACAPESAGNLCGLVGLFGVGPLVSAVAIATYACLRARSAARSPRPTRA
jgi:hypothetical protein